MKTPLPHAFGQTPAGKASPPEPVKPQPKDPPVSIELFIDWTRDRTEEATELMSW
jgi:hypothetical protein